ncbi:hypothetical protein F441_11830 [Phytophthora nicotianae CJ01A1]|uniref:Uncharacterized protein n=4 Tax=Phytophthora nicotianae TaxID=4792 RepID=V9EYE7_PHYNI|nr:hypothetical protein F443_11870 [Phytophthora nicotianae P1569]ETL36534.1 hypothetical protein L916_11498 [Phytophthora nicotianae]ETL89751.1 hypothetical protein L917_11365 [Phytophthora nicotianae]ETP12861.1 hypothetical protein F441_11830 [Phytophthora nicotianae CJ01A1]ETP27601.1 hypothetical protein F442_23123 [Phytophthora nicotianae P10297]
MTSPAPCIAANKHELTNASSQSSAATPVKREEREFRCQFRK